MSNDKPAPRSRADVIDEIVKAVKINGGASVGFLFTLSYISPDDERIYHDRISYRFPHEDLDAACDWFRADVEKMRAEAKAKANES